MSIFYDAQESANEAVAAAQIEYDKREFDKEIASVKASHESDVRELEDALYCAAMACADAGDNRLCDWMKVICSSMKLEYPPRQLQSLAF